MKGISFENVTTTNKRSQCNTTFNQLDNVKNVKKLLTMNSNAPESNDIDSLMYSMPTWWNQINLE